MKNTTFDLNVREEQKMSDTKRKYYFAGIAVFMAVALMVWSDVRPASAAGKAQMFATPEAAVQNFVDALRKNDNASLRLILGPDSSELVSSGDAVADEAGRAKFLGAFDVKNQIVKEGEGKAELVIGTEEWPFPIPIIKDKTGWFFDTKSGKEEILNRRIGRNELRTVQTLLAIVDAEREYAMKDRDGNGVLEYAAKFRSDPGKKNGLYWKAGEGEEQSPLGSLAANAQQEHYFAQPAEEGPQPYHGYLFKMLKKQGVNAQGGAYEYEVNGAMVGGFAVVAYPVQYGNSGVMTFIVNHDGVVYEKDLGPDTPTLATEIDSFDPDASWQKAPTTIE